MSLAVFAEYKVCMVTNGSNMLGLTAHVPTVNIHRIQTLSLVATTKWPFTYYVSSYNKAGSVRMLTNADLRDQGFIEKLMSYENP